MYHKKQIASYFQMGVGRASTRHIRVGIEDVL